MGKPNKPGQTSLYNALRGVTSRGSPFMKASRYVQQRRGRSKAATEVTPLTSQRDVVVSYRKRRMPRRKKRRYVRGIKRWRSQQMRQLPARISNFTYSDVITCNQDASQYFGFFGNLCANNVYDNNIGNCFNQMTNDSSAELKATAGGVLVKRTSVRVVLRNTTSVGVAGASGTVDVDVYKVICQRDIPLDEWTAGLYVESFMVTCKNKLRQHKGMDFEVSDTGTGIATAQQNAGNSSTNQAVGDVLWNNPPFLRFFKIVKQFKVQLPVGDITEFSWRMSRPKYVTRDVCFGNASLAAKKGLTYGYIFNINGRAYKDGANPVGYSSCSVIMEGYTRYNFKVGQSFGADTLVHQTTTDG